MNDHNIDEEIWEDIPLPSTSSLLSFTNSNSSNNITNISSTTSSLIISPNEHISESEPEIDDIDDKDEEEDDDKLWYNMVTAYGLDNDTSEVSIPIPMKIPTNTLMNTDIEITIPLLSSSTTTTSTSTITNSSTNPIQLVYDPPYTPYLILARRTHFLSLLAHHQYINNVANNELLQSLLLSIIPLSYIPNLSSSSSNQICIPSINTIQRITNYCLSRFPIYDYIDHYNHISPPVIYNYGLNTSFSLSTSTNNNSSSMTEIPLSTTKIIRKNQRLIPKAIYKIYRSKYKSIQYKTLYSLITKNKYHIPQPVTILQFTIIFLSLMRSLGYKCRLNYTYDPLLLSQSSKEKSPSMQSTKPGTNMDIPTDNENIVRASKRSRTGPPSKSSSPIPSIHSSTNPTEITVAPPIPVKPKPFPSQSLSQSDKQLITSQIARKLPGIRYWFEIYGKATDTNISTSTTSSSSLSHTSFQQRWIYIDPIRQWYDSPQLLEPNLRSKNNPFVYIFATNQYNEFYDVTRRYTLQWSQVVKIRDLQGMNVPSLVIPEQVITVQRRLSRSGITLGKSGMHTNVQFTKERNPRQRKRVRTMDEIFADIRNIENSNDIIPNEYEPWLEHTLRICNQGKFIIPHHPSTNTINVTTVHFPTVIDMEIEKQKRQANTLSDIIDLTDESNPIITTVSRINASNDAVKSLSSSFSSSTVLSSPPVVVDEETELVTSATANETFPTKITDYQNHPRYALESQLNIWQTIYPKSSTNILGYFKGMAIYPRSHVHYLRTVDQWLKLFGKQVRSDQVATPYKRISKAAALAASPNTNHNRGRGKSSLSNNTNNSYFSPIEFDFRYNNLHTGPVNNRSTVDIVQNLLDEQNISPSSTTTTTPNIEYAVYGEWQTQPYTPRPIAANEPVPKNAYGNFELFHPAFLPRGLVHIEQSKAKQAAEQLRIDYAEVVTGFRPRASTGMMPNQNRFLPDIQGIVIHEHDKDTVIATAEALEQTEAEKAAKKREEKILKRFEKLVRGILIRDRIFREYGTTTTTNTVPGGTTTSSSSSTTTLTSSSGRYDASGSADSVANIIYDYQRKQKAEEDELFKEVQELQKQQEQEKYDSE